MSVDVPAYLQDLAVYSGKTPRSLATVLLRNDVEVGRELLTQIATGGSMSFDQLIEWCRSVMSAGVAHDVPPGVDEAGLAGLGRLLAGQPDAGVDHTTSADVHQALRILRRGVTLDRSTDVLDAQTNLAVGRREYVARILPTLDLSEPHRWMLECDLANPFGSSGPDDEEAWLQTANRYLAGFGLAPIALLDEATGAPYDRLTSHAATPAPGDQPLVTIITSVFSPGPSLVTALRSLVAQTWSNLQILLVDDCSPPEFDDVITRAAAMDERIELVRMPRNGGTYVIRNHALTLARGEVVGFQDSDDWSHPERVARQMQVLRDDPSVVATTSRALRLFEDLTANLVGFSPERTNVSSLMFRRQPVVERLGAFDPVRKAADTEFMERIALAFGPESFVKLPDPLALVQLTHGSLSRAEFRIDWRHPSRVAYRANFGYWHDLIERGDASPHLDPDGDRPFPAPARLLGRPEPELTRCDVVHVADWRVDTGRHVGAPGQVIATAESGLETGVLHAEVPRYARQPRLRLDASVLAAVRDGRIDRHFWGDAVHARLLLIDDAETMGYLPPPELVSLTADRVIVTAAFPPRAPDGWAVYEPEIVEREVRRRWDRLPVWLPASTLVADALKMAGAEGRILDPRPWAAIRTRPRALTGPRTSGRPVIGTTGLDLPLKDRASWASLLARFPDDDAFDVRILDRAGVIDRARAGEPVPPNWLVLTNGALDAFLDQLDVFVAVPTRSWGPAPPWPVMQAMARGCAVLLDPSLESIFGAAAHYADEADVPAAVEALVADRAGFAEQQDRGVQLATSLMSSESYVRMIRDLLDSTIEGDA